MMSGAARKSMLPMFVGLKPHVSVPEASRPVENRPPNTMRMPSHAEESERFGLVRPTIKNDDAADGEANQDREDGRRDGLKAFALQEVFFFHTAASSFAMRLAPAM